MKSCPRRFLVPSGLGLLAILMALLVGCSKAKDLKPVSGTVTFKDAPVNNAMIQFLPTPDSTATSQAAATIQDGKYELPAHQGLMPGKYQVLITSRPQRPDKKRGSTSPRAFRASMRKQQREVIPERFNAKTTLECEVMPDGPNTFNFDLK